MRYTGCAHNNGVSMKPDLKGLTKLAEYLCTVPAKEFNMRDWKLESPCGTTACIAGHAATLFPRRFQLFCSAPEDAEYKDYWFSHRVSGVGGSKGFATGFRISHEDALDLTISKRSVGFTTPKQAARAVRKLVARLEREMEKK